jgi:hypothetical protein
METKIYAVCFEDFDYENWTRECGAEFIKLEPTPNGPHLYVRGTPAAHATFSADLGFGPLA